MWSLPATECPFILDWIDRQAIRLPQGALIPQRWVVWCKRTHRQRSGRIIEYYVLIIRLPSYAWDYKINIDDYGWVQNALLWYSQTPDPNSSAMPKAGFNWWHLSPLERK